jgi:hypothetical protein
MVLTACVTRYLSRVSLVTLELIYRIALGGGGETYDELFIRGKPKLLSSTMKRISHIQNLMEHKIKFCPLRRVKEAP